MECLFLNQRFDPIFYADNGSEEQVPSQLRNMNLLANVSQVAILGWISANCKSCNFARIGGSYSRDVRCLENQRAESKADADSDAGNKVVETHRKNDHNNSKILERL